MRFIIFLTSVISISFLFQYCSSSVETEKEEEKVRYEEKKSVKNVDLEERDYISAAKIKSIEKVSFNLDSDGKPSGSEKLSTLKYDSKGFLTETIIYDPEGKVQATFSYDYDNNGRRSKTSRFENGKLVNYYTYVYNEHGNKIKAERFNSSGEIEEYYIYEYDDDGNLVSEEWYSAPGEKIYSIENDYQNGLKTKSSTFDENEKMIYEYVYQYDQKGNIVEELKYDDLGKKAGVIQYLYKYF
jgi:hypothetical protein